MLNVRLDEARLTTVPPFFRHKIGLNWVLVLSQVLHDAQCYSRCINYDESFQRGTTCSSSSSPHDRLSLLHHPFREEPQCVLSPRLCDDWKQKLDIKSLILIKVDASKISHDPGCAAHSASYRSSVQS